MTTSKGKQKRTVGPIGRTEFQAHVSRIEDEIIANAERDADPRVAKWVRRLLTGDRLPADGAKEK
jgi:hypothetical protein